MDRYRKIRVIGAGSFGIAWLAESNLSGKNYALKELNVSSMSERDRHLALNEVKILSRLKHKNVVRYKEAFVHDSKLFIAMEFAKQGDLSTRIKQQNGQYFKEQKILEWFTQLCLALKHIHARNILHRDLKTENIFLGKDDVIKLGDFGIARVLDSTTDHAQTAVGTPYYMSPEICQHKLYNHKSDMWSLGCVLYELTTLQHPFTADNFSVLVIKILQGEYPPTPSCFGPLLEDLISVLLNRSPEQRPSAKQLLHVPAMRPYVEMYVSYDHSRINSDAPKVSMLDERTPRTEGCVPKEASLSAHKAAKIKDDVKRGISSATDRRLIAVNQISDHQIDFSEGLSVPSVKLRKASSAKVSARKRSSHEPKRRSHFRRCTEASKVHESCLKDSPKMFSQRAPDVNIEVFHHSAVFQPRENFEGARNISARCRDNLGISDVLSKRSVSVADASAKPKQQNVARIQCDNEKRINSRNLERDQNQKKHAKKYSAASENNENVSLGDSKQKLSSSQAGSSTKALKPMNCTEKQQAYQARETDLRNRTYTVICKQCPCASHTPTKEKKKREIETSQSESCEDQCSGHKKHVHENRDEPFAKNFDNHPPAVKSTLCEEKPELNNIADSAFARIEALRMFLESRLGTRLLTHAYRYLTKTSPKEKESEVYMDLTELLGTEHVAYVPILQQLIACETIQCCINEFS